MSRAGMAFVFACTSSVTASSVTLADGPPLQRRVSTADAYAYTPPPEQLFYNWSGLYGGGHLGWNWGNRQGTLTTVATESLVQREGAFIGGVQAGYMHQFRDLVLGAEIKHSWTGTEFNHASVAQPGLGIATRVNDVTTITGRVGYAYMNWLAYWKAGWASAGIEQVASGVATGTTSSRGDGWVAGGGIAYAFGPNIIGGIEYDYVHVNVGAATPAAGVALSSHGLDLQSVTVRLDFKFGH